jgi:hypothetical protein
MMLSSRATNTKIDPLQVIQKLLLPGGRSIFIFSNSVRVANSRVWPDGHKRKCIMASSVTAELLKQLSTASEALNNVSDVFNDQIKVIEEALASYNLGVSAWAVASSQSEYEYGADGTPVGEFTREILVGYEKRKGKWCLMASSHITEFDHWEEWVLRDAPRERRMQAIAGIPKLLEKLIAEANKLAAEVTEKTTEARMLAVSIKPKKGQ